MRGSDGEEGFNKNIASNDSLSFTGFLLLSLRLVIGEASSCELALRSSRPQKGAARVEVTSH